MGKTAKQILGDKSTRLLLPAIALAEALFILEKGRGQYAISERKLLARIRADSRIRVVALGQQILDLTLQCKTIDEMHDRQIVATAIFIQNRGFSTAILTKDANIAGSGLIPCVW
ncbi:MAG: twitching motility protein PilT [Chloroflexi bacterium]|nr:twitching motility protein PilT [Chloroflexota bacterium]